MNYEEAKQIIQSDLVNYEQLQMARKIAVECIEKQIPKKPIEIWEYSENDLFGLCPLCNEGVYNEMKYCSTCGQALDWSVYE